MKSVLGYEFWKKELVKQFGINDIGIGLLDLVYDIDSEKAFNYIISQFKKMHRDEIIEMFSEEYTKDKIDLILKDLGERKISKMEIEEFAIKTEELEESEEM